MAEPGTGRRGVALREHVLDLVGAVEFRVNRGPDGGAPTPELQAFARSLRESILLLQRAHAALPWLEATRRPSINMGSLYLTEDYARILVGPDVDLVVVPNPEFMYSTSSWMFSEVINGTPGFTPATTRRPIVMNYPLSDSDRLLLHPVFAHELGHASTQQHSLISNVENELAKDVGFANDFTAAATSLASVWGGDQTSRERGLRQLLRRWIEELLCDHLACEVAGPSFLWAFATFVMPIGYGVGSLTHPPNTLRIRLLIAQLEELGWRSYLNQVAPAVMAWLDGIATYTHPGLPPPFGFLHDQLLSHGDVIRNTAAAQAANRGLEPSSAAAGAKVAFDLLQDTVLPIGLDEPLNPGAILLGGWQFAISQHGDKPAGVVAALTDRQLQELIGKAIEMSVVTSTWNGD